MPNTAVHASCTRGPLISAEGINGVGKTYLTNRAVETLREAPLMLDEFSERVHGRHGLGEHLLDALREASSGDPFLRGGTPMAEALLLIAMKRHDLDTVLPHLAVGRPVVEGRSVDTTAVYQALLLHPDDPEDALDTARALLDLAASYRTLPDLTILVTDDAPQAVERAQRRDRRVLTPEQAAFMVAACRLYERLAATDPGRYRVVDRREVDEFTAAELIRSWILGAGAGLRCVREPWQGPRVPCPCCGRGAEPVPA
ncbi:thymidylate kinase [Nocardiopsis sp. MG754419]|uniref:thymidylate kinase n=1 Tax=Nocardiopsis sp. MG754419 TaxID=2259865 RepID=UPI001BA660B8|nr:thymidylate kinase [Nocardiopsis sp. MG754419]MBR8742583.1 thymidylate kinase [Nocardiopsis sp. MG754419]